MLSFTDLIKKGVAPSPYKTDIIGNEMPDLDRFIVNYNNIWGCISDTHMSKGDDGRYYITGQLFRNAKQTTQFVYAITWGNYQFCHSSVGANCLAQYCENNGKYLTHEIVNGDNVLVVNSLSAEEIELLIKSRQGFTNSLACKDQSCETPLYDVLNSKLSFKY